jgi:hypothetical protein
MKKQICLFLLLTIVLSFSFGEGRGKAQFELPRMYVYTMASTIAINPYDGYDFNASQSNFTFLNGFGCNIVNFYNRYKINFEMEFTSPNFEVFSDKGVSDVQKIRLTYSKITFQYILPGNNISAFGGFGAANIKFLENDILYAADITAMTLQLGAKLRIIKNVSLRAEFTHFLIPGETDDELEVYTDDTPLASIFAIGAEYHF